MVKLLFSLNFLKAFTTRMKVAHITPPLIRMHLNNHVYSNRMDSEEGYWQKSWNKC